MNDTMRLKMKKYILFILCITLFIACTNDGLKDDKGYGRVALSVDAYDNISIKTRATPQELSNYLISVYQNDKLRMNPVKYSVLTGGSFIMEAGEGYVVNAESCTLDEAESTNTNWGQLRLAGASSTFAVAINETVPVAFTCFMQNARINVAYSPSFVETFTDYSVTVYKTAAPKRSLTFDGTANITTQSAFFNIDANTELTYIVNAKYNGNDRTYNGKITLAPATWQRITFRATDYGDIQVAISIDNTVTDEEHDASINPYA